MLIIHILIIYFRQEILVLKAQLVALESKTGELFENQEAAASEVATALQAVISRLLGLVTELMSSYTITEQDLEVLILYCCLLGLKKIISHYERSSI